MRCLVSFGLLLLIWLFGCYYSFGLICYLLVCFLLGVGRQSHVGRTLALRGRVVCERTQLLVSKAHVLADHAKHHDGVCVTCVKGCTGARVCVCVCVWMCVWVCGCVWVCVCGCLWVFVGVCGCLGVWVRGCVDLWMCGCVDVCMCVCVCVPLADPN